MTERRQRGLDTYLCRCIEQAEFVEQQPQRPEVDGNVMYDQQKNMIPYCTSKQMHPQERFTLQIERSASRVGETGRQGVFAPGGRIRGLEVELWVFVDVLLGLPI